MTLSRRSIIRLCASRWSACWQAACMASSPWYQRRSYALSFQEKEEILATVIDQVKGRVPVYAGTGCITTAETIRMSKRAEEMGADALSIITPSFALASQKELYDHYVAVAKQVNIPIILYNIPPRTGNKLLPETVQALCRDVDVIVGAKDSSGDIENLKAYIRLTRELDKDVAILAGNDGAILTCLKEGGAGGIAGRANIWPATVAKIYDCFKLATSRAHRPLRTRSPSCSRPSSTATPTPSSRPLWPCRAITSASAVRPSTTSPKRVWKPSRRSWPRTLPRA